MKPTRTKPPKQVAVVAGGGGSIGTAVCEALSPGVAVVVLDVDATSGERAARRVRERGGSGVAFPCDVRDEREIDRIVTSIEADYGPPSILVHAAGFGGPFHRVDEVPAAEWDRIVDTNLKSAFLLSKRLLPAMKNAAFGRLIFVASVQGLMGAPLSSAYVASKHGLIGFARAVAAEWGQFGITSNAVCPGYVNTKMGPQPGVRPDHVERILARTPSKRIAEPEEVASLVAFLISDSARHVNGAALVVDGGMSADLGV